MMENEFEKFALSLLENSFANFRQSGKTGLTKDLYETIAESFKRMESKRKESLFTDLWNKECFMDVASNYECVLRMEILSCYYIADENGKRVDFNVSFNEYEKNNEGKGYKFKNSERCEFAIKFYEKDGKADFERIFAKLYYEIEELYEQKVISIKTFSDFVGFNIDSFFSYKPKSNVSNSTYGAFAPSDKEVENKGNEMKDFKETIKNIFGEEVADKAIKLAEKLEKEFTELKDKTSEKVEEVKPKVNEAKNKAKSVFETIIDELQNKSEEVKGSFNAMKKAVKKPADDETNELFDVTLTALEVFVANKVEINEQVLRSIERYKQAVLGRRIEISGLRTDEDVNITVSDSDFTGMLEVYLCEDSLIDDELRISELEFITSISFEGVENSSCVVAKISVGELMDVFIKFIPTDYDIVSK